MYVLILWHRHIWIWFPCTHLGYGIVYRHFDKCMGLQWQDIKKITFEWIPNNGYAYKIFKYLMFFVKRFVFLNCVIPKIEKKL